MTSPEQAHDSATTAPGAANAPRVTVVGAGVAGLTCAHAFALRGARVTIVERNQGTGQGCSWFAGGMLAPWCERESAEPLVAELGFESLEYWRREVPDVPREGSLVLAPPRDLPDLRRFARRTEAFEWLDGPALAALEPDLAGRFDQGLFFPTEAHLEPRKALAALTGKLVAEHGVEIRFGCSVVDDESDPATDGADIVVDCRGLSARDRLADLRGVKGEMLVLFTREIALKRPVRMLHPRIPVYVVPRGDGHFMIGATSIENDQRGRVTGRSMLELLSAVYQLHPAFGEAEIVEIGADVRPAFPDNLPRIRKRGRTIFVNGFYRHGFLAAPALARRAAEVALDGAYFPEVMDEDRREW
ncbi:FAD-dependent oxidoreductase [Ancylobacter lacus]|uniref:FAD-dependent oxidoreductase n=1 Tax=Ancylobacter lacus TaxID=2579970 RepID=UPI001BCF4AD1|nr:FAD-dependent oxidoreductase [Ancylobacter lacus]MBS7537453.1 FAD-dependent oxidoreductase [Ancylobacter lacus]